MATSPPDGMRRNSAAAAAAIVLLTALAYAAVGGAALMLAGPPGYASPLYPSAGIALAAVLVYGARAVPGVWLGAFAVNAGLGLLRGQQGWALVHLPLLIGAGAALQAWAGAALLRRYVPQPFVLQEPSDIARAGLLGALLACVVSPSIAVPALLANGVLGPDQWAATWLTWWAGDSLGVLIGAPLALTLIGRPAAEWVPRRRTVGLPLLVAMALLVAAMAEFGQTESRRVQASFERDAERLAINVQSRLRDPVLALQALHGVARHAGDLDRETLSASARWWLTQPMHLQAMGFSVRVPTDQVPAFEARARSEGADGYRVFDRDDGSARAADGEVVALRHIEPEAGNAPARGVNALSIPAARTAILASRDSGLAVSTAGFRLTQAAGDDTGVVIYQALYRGAPADAAARLAQFRGTVFVTINAERTMTGVAATDQAYLRWCLVDPAPGVPRPRLAGRPGCESDAALSLQRTQMLDLAGRALALHVGADAAAVPGRQPEAGWLLATVGLVAAAMLGALLLTITGHARRTERAVLAGTADLRHEIAERAQVEAALRDSQKRLRSILDHVPLGVMFVDPQGVILECNPKLSEMTGRSVQDLLGRSVADFMSGDALAAAQRLRHALLVGGTVPTLEPIALRQVEGGELMVRAVAAALRNEQGRVVSVVAVLEDVTEHLRLQESARSLQRAQAASQAKSEFLSRMSHELRTPLNAMIGFAQLLGMPGGTELDKRQREWTQQIQHAGWHLLELINETLDLARIESGAARLDLTPVPLAPAMAACQAMVAASAEQRGVTLTVVSDIHVPAVLGDATRVKQVLTNLLSNAIKYNRRGGGVTVSSRPAAGGMVEVAVSDTGLGMTEMQMASLFEPYNRLGREGSGVEGTGIGLVISRRLAELMGGSLGVSSRAGEGSTFTLRLPAATEAPTPEAVRAGVASAPYHSRLVHYVEDNETNVEVMRGIFMQRPQVRLETSTLGLDGLTAIRATRPDLILLDMHLPDISGLELLRHLKQDDDVAAIPVVVVSADATTRQTEAALTSGALHYVTKPLDVADFLRRIDEILDGGDSRLGS